MFDVVVLTDRRYTNPKNIDPYIKNVLLEDQLVLDSLRSQNISCTKKAWSDPEFDWSTTKYILFRTTWDYADDFDKFQKWLEDTSLKTTMINSFDLIRWNLDKHYLIDLAKKGVNIVETVFLPIGEKRKLKEIHEEQRWEKTVLKPAISAAAKDTYKLNSIEIPEEIQERYSTLSKSEAFLLQPFQRSIVERGEISMVMIGGVFTHAVLKIAKPGDFRVQDDFGGTVHDYKPTADEIELATLAVNACETLPIYARIDIVMDNNNEPAVSELELVEPELWFRKETSASDILAENISKLL